MKKLFFVMLIFLGIVTNSNLYSQNFYLSLNSAHGFSDTYNNSNYSEDFQKKYSYKNGLLVSFNIINQKHYLNTGLFLEVKGDIYPLEAYTDAQQTILQTYYSHLYLHSFNLPVSYSFYFTKNQNLQQYISIGLSNLILYKVSIKLKNFPETIYGRSTEDVPLEYTSIGISYLNDSTWYRIYNTAFDVNLGIKKVLSDKFFLDVSINTNMNLKPHRKDENLSYLYEYRYYFIGLKIGFGILK